MDYTICYLVDGVQVHQDKYETLSDLIDQELSVLDFDSLIRIGMDAMPEEPVVPDLTGQPVTREGDTLTIGNGPATHEVDITVSDEEWERIKETIPDPTGKAPDHDGTSQASGRTLPPPEIKPIVSADEWQRANEAIADRG